MSPTKPNGNEITTTASTDPRDALLMQIHEQFAVNHTSTFGSLITLFAAMVVVLGAYGYYTIDLIKEKTDKTCASNVLIFVTSGCVVVFTIIAIISIYQGYKYRIEQLVIDNIRKHYDTKNEIFGKDEFDNGNIVPWTAQGKGLRTYLPGFYNLFSFISAVLIIVITVVTLFLTSNINPWYTFKDYAYCLIVTLILSLTFIICTWFHFFTKYDDKNEKKRKQKIRKKIKILIIRLHRKRLIIILSKKIKFKI